MSSNRLFPTSALAASVFLSLAPAAWATANEAAAAASAAALPATVDHDNLWNLAARLPPTPGATRQQVMVALLRLNPQAFLQGNMHRLRRGIPLTVPSAQEIAAEDAARAEQLVQAHLTALDAGQAVPALQRLPLPAGGGSTAAAPGAVRPATPAPILPVPAASRAPVAANPVPAPTSQASTPAREAAAAPKPAPADVPAGPSSVPAAPSSAPASAQASAPEAARQITPPPPSSSSPSPQPSASAPQPDAAAPAPTVRWLPYALLVVLAGGAVLLWQRRRSREQFNESVISSFFDENGVRRPSRPKVIDVSQAGVETARTVETLQSAAELVRDSASSVMPLRQADDPYRETALKLEIARTCLEVGRTDAARLMLQIVRREGSAAQQLLAGDLLDRLAPA